jgi:hypothetical protein
MSDIFVAVKTAKEKNPVGGDILFIKHFLKCCSYGALFNFLPAAKKCRPDGAATRENK